MDEKTIEALENVLRNGGKLLVAEDDDGHILLAAIESHGGWRVYILPTVWDHQQYMLEFATRLPDQVWREGLPDKLKVIGVQDER